MEVLRVALENLSVRLPGHDLLKRRLGLSGRLRSGVGPTPLAARRVSDGARPPGPSTAGGATTMCRGRRDAVIDERRQASGRRLERRAPAPRQRAHPRVERSQRDVSRRAVVERGKDRGQQIRGVAAEQIAAGRRCSRPQRVEDVDHLGARERDSQARRTRSRRARRRSGRGGTSAPPQCRRSSRPALRPVQSARALRAAADRELDQVGEHARRRDRPRSRRGGCAM